MNIIYTNKIRCVKHNRARIKIGRRDESTNALLDFFRNLQGKVKGLQGYVVMDNMKDEQESLVLTFWQTKEDMDAFYRPDNEVLTKFVENAKPFFDQMPERTDHLVKEFRLD